MRFRFHPAWLFAALYVAFVAFVTSSLSQLPDRLATHFSAAGEPDGWSTREQWRTILLVLGTALPFAMVGLFWLIRLFPVSAWNIPRRDYWLSPGERPATLAWILRHGWWLGCLELAFFIGVHWLIVHANTVAPPALLSGPVLAGLGLFLGGIALWASQIYRRFARPV